MPDRFESLSRGLAEPMPRRRMLRTTGAALAAGVAAAVLKPFRADAAACPAGTTPCGSTTSGPNCCPAGVACANAKTATCGCPAGTARCGSRCCGKAETCTNTSPAGACCCPAGTTPCGPTCCPSGIACKDKSKGVCGCPAGRTPCIGTGGLTCCDPGTTCRPDNSTCVAPPTAQAANCLCSLSNPCPPGSCCSNGTCMSSCPDSETCIDFGPGGFCSGNTGCCSCSFFAGTFCLADVPEGLCLGEFAFLCEFEVHGTPGFTSGPCPTNGFCSVIP